MTISWPRSRTQVLDAYGRPYLSLAVSFFAGGTTTPLTVFRDAARTLPWAQPVEADANGRFPLVFLPDGLYGERVVEGLYRSTLWFDDGLGTPIPEEDTTTGAGATDPIDATALPSTGDTKWRPDALVLPGWVRMNGRTVGNGDSGASEFASSTAQKLFKHLWQNFPDTVASVVGGRGANADADFAASKAITVPSMQGLLAYGLDDMGSGPANRLQVSTTIKLTSGSKDATLGSVVGVVREMSVVAVGVPAGTYIESFSGTSVKLSQAAAASSTGTVDCRLSLFGDAQVPGGLGGRPNAALTLAQLPADLPDSQVTVSYPAHGYEGGTGTTAVQAGNQIGDVMVKPAGKTTSPPAPQTYPVVIDNPGGGQSFGFLPSGRTGTWYMKL